MIKKTYQEINEKIRKGEAVVVTAEEIIGIVKEKGIEEATKQVDVVTTGTFGPMCSSGAFLNFGHSDPPIKMSKITLNNVTACGGLAAVDTYIGATEESLDRGREYGGAHVICDLIDGKEIELKAKASPTDCYPRSEVQTNVRLEDLNEAYLFNPRNAYQNYAAAINTSDKKIYTYMGILKPSKGNINYSTSGELSPLLNDPNYRTIGIGTRIFLAGAQGYVSWQGTQFNSSANRGVNGVTLGPAATLAVIGDLKDMDTEYIQPAVFENYGTSIFVGIGIPIPILDEDMMKKVCVENKDIYTSVIDYSVKKKNKPSVAKVSYEELRSGKVVIDGKEIKTTPLSSLQKARKIANELKFWIENGNFFIQEPIQRFPQNNIVKAMKIKEE
ncbi:homocysteine biosynthesis protein [Clostridiaceae bacterium M8S5]|nr:homocysteine biosynthesis protein [Clostridiaceae bacterium M8S5]